MQASPEGTGAAIIGSGYIADRHATALRAAGVPLVGMWSPTAERAERAARSWSVPRAESVSELLSMPGVSHVHVCTPTTSHAHYIDLAIDSGLAVVSEKPLTTDGETAQRLAHRANAAGVVNLVTFNRRYDLGIQLFTSLYRAGDIGTAVMVYGTYQQEWNAPVSTRDWRFDPAAVGPSRVISEIGSHWLDLASYVTASSITEVVAQTSTMGEREYLQDGVRGTFTPENEDAFSALLRFEGGARGSVSATQLAHGAWDDITLRVDGTAGSLSWTSARPNQVTLARKGHGSRILGNTGPTTSIESMVAGIYSPDDTVCADFAAGAENCAVQDAVIESSATDRWATVRRTA